MNPKKAGKTSTFLGVFHPCTSVIFAGFMLILPGEMMHLRYLVVFVWNSHFSGLTKTPLFRRVMSTFALVVCGLGGCRCR